MKNGCLMWTEGQNVEFSNLCGLHRTWPEMTIFVPSDTLHLPPPPPPFMHPYLWVAEGWVPSSQAEWLQTWRNTPSAEVVTAAAVAVANDRGCWCFWVQSAFQQSSPERFLALQNRGRCTFLTACMIWCNTPQQPPLWRIWCWYSVSMATFEAKICFCMRLHYVTPSISLTSKL